MALKRSLCVSRHNDGKPQLAIMEVDGSTLCVKCARALGLKPFWAVAPARTVWGVNGWHRPGSIYRILAIDVDTTTTATAWALGRYNLKVQTAVVLEGARPHYRRGRRVWGSTSREVAEKLLRDSQDGDAAFNAAYLST